jgi:endonuclease/exonuclease/phosphatase family metal-dependent hydrolase
MKTRLLILTLVFFIALHAPIHAQQTVPFAGDRTVTVMTQNLYSGVDEEIFAVPFAASPFDLATKVLDVYNGYFARDFPARAERIASEVAATRPDLIALQEAILVRTQTPSNPETPATTLALDFVQILQSALAAKGLHYYMVVESPGFDAQLPTFGFDVRHTEREVILARSDLSTADMKLSDPGHGNFAINCQLPGPLGTPPFTLTRGWASVDVKIRGKSFRLITTHLDPVCLEFFDIPGVQLAEAAELLSGPASTKLPLLVVGDFNSPAPTGGTYNLALSSGLTDVWNLIGFGEGVTCCQAPHLDNYPSLLDQRIDYVFFRGAWTALAATNVGQNLSDRTGSNLWPSDHAGVVARLKLPQP